MISKIATILASCCLGLKRTEIKAMKISNSVANKSHEHRIKRKPRKKAVKKGQTSTFDHMSKIGKTGVLKNFLLQSFNLLEY